MKWTACIKLSLLQASWFFILTFVLRLASGTKDGPYFTKQPQTIVTPPGDSVNFECQTNPPAEYYTWMRSGEVLENGTTVKILAGSLNIRVGLHYVEYQKQTGDYQCIAWFGSSGLTSIPGSLKIATLLPFPSRVGPESKLAVIEGNTAVIKCQAPYSDPRATIIFHKDGAVIEPDGARILIMDSGNLLIYDVRMNDSGAYVCHAHNQITNQVQVANVNTTLKVVSTPVPTPAAFKVRPPSTNKVLKGANITLECVAVGNPPPKVAWKKYGGRVDTGRHVMLRSNLKLVNVQRSDVGSYVCEAENGRGDPVKAVAEVEMQELPTITKKPTDDRVVEGTEAEFTCSAKGTPSPDIYWYFNGRKVQEVPGIRANANKVSIPRVKKEHAGMFQCFARNAYGIDTASAFLFVELKGITSSLDSDVTLDGDELPPRRKDKNERGGGRKKGRKPGRKPFGPDISGDAMEPPSRPNVTRLTDDSVMLSWEVPRPVTALPIQFFKVQYKPIRRRASWRTLDDEIPPHFRSYTVPGLETGQRYKFRILAAYANDDHSVGPTSRRFLLEPDSSDDRPSIAPQIVDATPEGPDELKITWEYQTKMSETRVEGFFIYYRSTTSAGDYQQVNVLGADVRSHVLRHLLPATTYDVKIQAFNMGGTSNFSSLRTAKTRDVDGKDAGRDGKRDETKAGSVFDIEEDSQLFGLSKEFPLYAVIAAVVSGVAFLVLAPCAVCYCRKRCRARGAPGRPFEGNKFHETALRLSQEEPKNSFELRGGLNGNGDVPNGGIRPLSGVALTNSPAAIVPGSNRLPGNGVSVSALALNPVDRVNGTQETSFMLVRGDVGRNSRFSTLPYQTRHHESCSTFQPSPQGDAHGEAARRDWRVVDSSPSEIEASWASQRLLSPSAAIGGEDEEEETERYPPHHYHQQYPVVMRRPAASGSSTGDRRHSNPVRPTSWKNDRRRSRDSVRLKREEIS